MSYLTNQSPARFYAKVEGDAYGNLPFLDLTPYGNVAHAQWTDLDKAWELPFISVDYHVNFQASRLTSTRLGNYPSSA